MNVRRVIDTVGSGPFARDSEPSQERDILNEPAFHRVILLERRRTERSHKPFLLMLLDLGDRKSVV